MSAPSGDETAPAAPFVSYSINFEDVVLRRLFPGRATGFFVDVGAEHPVLGNDFCGLYAQGWRGINVEPNPAYFALLQERRPGDTNLCLALSDVAGQDLAYFEVEGTGLSTCDEAQAAQYRADGRVVRRHDVRSATLTDVLDAAGSPRVDILKVDVEGLEEQVLRGNDWTRHRPLVVMVEATLPQTRVRRPTGIRASLEALGYRHIHFDNLNDFYAEAGFEVAPDATLPPNVFDGFVLHDTLSLREAVAVLRDDVAGAQTYARSLERGHASLDAERRSLQGELSSVRRVAVAAILGRGAELDACLATGHPSHRDQEGGRTMTQPGTALVTIDGEGVSDGAAAPPSAAIRAEMIEARLQACAEHNARLLADADDLRHENSRLLASLRQAQGENLSLQRALGPSYAARDELLQVHGALAALQSQVERHHRAMSEDFDSRVQAAAAERVARMDGQDDGPGQPGRAGHADARMLQAVLASTSWRVTRPLRALRSLFGPAQP